METITTAEQIGFISDCDILYSLERSISSGYYYLTRKNKILGTAVMHAMSEQMAQVLKHNQGNVAEARALILQNLINSEWRLIDSRSRG